jgi:membrane protein DedA with SNARE-associated domain
MFLSLKHYEQAETFFQKHGSVTTFNGRFIPAVRQLISIPA